ncbi:MAG: spore coat protein [Candidatus Taylorbacteria bacterium RIFCSPHIGHO2_01_FULL_46_22b]|uniref:glucose-1-phosphate thymidylyltransferase n=1 Tax=Candidatus Taylorbacteria bacterium RIFCSPHIGHO2_01_FULL_46_22b TaxID=1802301 RepID=A0A1G2M3J1_9BACT|nr:MAG: spore coat protein [Candidatus Taylorbacteria bacterium RIFCSPHIGHO2_01_FULL_46_22b]
MKGVILAGGLGTRLHPLTKITNKHLLPIYDRPMILYAIDTLKKSGLEEILIVCGREHAGHFMNFLGSGKEYGVKLSYALQDRDNGGIADALSYAEDFSDKDSIAAILGDNIFQYDFKQAIQKFEDGAKAFFKQVKNPRRFGVPVFNTDKTKILKIEEKPKNPKSDFAQVGFYLYDHSVFAAIRKLKPSGRGELEITDVNNLFLKRGQLHFEFIKGFWSDAGTVESLFAISTLIARQKTKKKESKRHD